MNIIDITNNYFKYFSNKDINSLKNYFAENIVLRDWNIFADGKIEVIKANEEIFKSLNSIHVTPKKFYQDGLTVLCEIEIMINEKELLKVLDIIKFNEKKLIVEISAYKQ